jgi:hypothetical protein
VVTTPSSDVVHQPMKSTHDEIYARGGSERKLSGQRELEAPLPHHLTNLVFSGYFHNLLTSTDDE